MKKVIFLFIFFLLFRISSAQTISGGGGHSLAICNNGIVQAWGYNDYGQLGNGTNITASSVPVPVSSITDVIALAGGRDHSLALKNDSTVWAWGNNTDGELGNGTNINSNFPVQVISLTGITSIAAKGWEHSLALKNDGTVWTWGLNSIGQFGDGTNSNSNIPVQLTSLKDITAITGGEYHSLALKNDGTVWAWGRNIHGQLGNNTNIDSNLAVQVSLLTGIISISAGDANSFALKNDGTIWAWGGNSTGELGNGTNTNSNLPVQVSSLTGIIAIAHSLALKNDGTVWAWGNGLSGQLGNGASTNSNIPVLVNSLNGIIAIADGNEHSLALKNDGTIWAWGENSIGQLGNGTSVNSNVPVQVIGLCQVTTAITEVEEKEAEINVFPNPSNRAITVSITNNSTKREFIIRVTNSLGKTVYSENVKIISDSFTKQIDLSKLSKGMYFIEMIADGKKSVEKIVLN